MRFLKSFFLAVLLTITYCVVACSWLLVYAGVTDWSSALYITMDSQAMIWLSFFQFLVDNSFCPWLMIFRGRPSTQIILEVNHHFFSIFDISSGFSMAAFSAFCTCLTELSFGPAVGIGLMFLWSYISHKLYTLAYTKLFNRRK